MNLISEWWVVKVAAVLLRALWNVCYGIFLTAHERDFCQPAATAALPPPSLGAGHQISCLPPTYTASEKEGEGVIKERRPSKQASKPAALTEGTAWKLNLFFFSFLCNIPQTPSVRQEQHRGWKGHEQWQIHKCPHSYIMKLRRHGTRVCALGEEGEQLRGREGNHVLIEQRWALCSSYSISPLHQR